MTLKEAMQYRGMTSAKLAKMVSVRHTTVKGWLENGLGGVEIELYGGRE